MKIIFFYNNYYIFSNISINLMLIKWTDKRRQFYCYSVFVYRQWSIYCVYMMCITTLYYYTWTNTTSNVETKFSVWAKVIKKHLMTKEKQNQQHSPLTVCLSETISLGGWGWGRGGVSLPRRCFLTLSVKGAALLDNCVAGPNTNSAFVFPAQHPGGYRQQ